MRTKITRAAVYARISDARDGDVAGVERQLEDSRRLAEQQGWTVVREYVDNNRSAYNGKTRPEFEQMLSDIEAGHIDAVAAYATDRLYRRLAELQRIVKYFARVQVQTVRSGHVDLSTADGKLLADLLGSVAEHESRKKGERIARAYAQRSEQGKFGGGMRRFGYTSDMSALVPEEADALRWAYSRIIDGGTLESIVREFKARGLRGSRGAEMNAVAVRGYLLRPVNGGLAAYKGEIVGTSESPAIVDADTWRAVRALLTDPARRTTTGRRPTSLLAPLLKCVRCVESGESRGRIGSKNRHRRSKNGKAKEAVYGCRNGCTSRRRERIDEAISEMVLTYLEQNTDKLQRPGTTTGSAVSSAAADAEQLRSRLDQLSALVATGDLAPADFATAAREIRTRLAAVEAKIAAETGRSAALSMVNTGDIRAAWDLATTDERREVISELIDHIKMGPAPYRGPKWTMEGITVVWRAQ